MNWEQKKEYRRKANARISELIEVMYEPGLSRIEKDIYMLERMELDIQPDSRYWRWGYKGVLKRARLALKEKMEREQDDKN